MNTVTVTMAAEPHLVTTVTNSTPGGSAGIANGIRPVTVVANSYSAGVPTLVTNGMMGGGRTNLAGPQDEEEEKVEGGSSGGEESRLNLLNSSPDEHEPLLRREQPPAERDHLHHHHHQQQPRSVNILSGRGSNTNNNNNNRLAPGSEVKIQSSEIKVERSAGSGVSRGGSSCPKPQSLPTLFLAGHTGPVSHPENKSLLPGPVGGVKSDHAPAPQAPPTSWVRGQHSEPGPNLQSALGTAPVLDSSQAPVLAPDTSVPAPEAPAPEAPAPEAPAPESSATAPEAQTPSLVTEAPAPEAPGLATSAPATETSAPAPAPEAPGLSEPQMRQAKARRPERPCSLDLSPSCTSSSGDVSLMDDGSRSVSGEKIKRRVKTPYALKKWRPATWVISTDTTFDLDSEFNNNSSHFSSNHHRPGNNGISKINQSKSSMAVFLVGGGTTATMTSDPNGMTCL